MEGKHFEVRSTYNTPLFCGDRPWAAISISTLGDLPVLADENRQGRCQLACADTAEPDRADLFTAAQAAALLDDVAAWSIAGLLINIGSECRNCDNPCDLPIDKDQSAGYTFAL